MAVGVNDENSVFNARKIKNIRNYVSIDDETVDEKFDESIMTVEHRSNNPKRDYLFVNKLQCKHIPCNPSKMRDMCARLASKVNVELNKIGVRNILVVGFAETATAIGTIVADNLVGHVTVLHTTREEVPYSKQLITFEEEHSHATTQKLLVKDDTDIKQLLHKTDYILFVEDEISTGNTIMNFIKALKKTCLCKENMLFGIASVCNWTANKEISIDDVVKSVDMFYLIGGELKDVNAKMNIDKSNLDCDCSVACSENGGLKDCNAYIEESRSNKKYSIIDLQDGEERESIFVNDRTLFNNDRFRKSDIDSKIMSVISGTKVKQTQSVRVIGTEECMSLPIMIGSVLDKAGCEVICHATTRSKIDVIISDFDGTASGIKSRHSVPSAYEEDRNTYIYNLEEYTDITIVISDTRNRKQFEKLMDTLTLDCMLNTNKVYGVLV